MEEENNSREIEAEGMEEEEENNNSREIEAEGMEEEEENNSREIEAENGEQQHPLNNEKKRKPRLIVRLGSLLVSHYLFVSVVCCVAGAVSLLLLPVLAKNTYISENALLPGSATPMFSGQDVSEAKNFVRDITDMRYTDEDKRIELWRLIAQHMADVGAEVYHHKFHSHSTRFHPLQFFSCTPGLAIIQTNHSCSLFGVNSVGIIRAPHGDGKEAIVLVTPYNSENIQLNEAFSLGLAYSIFSLLSRVAWLAKDIVWLAADSRHGEYTAVSAWLKDYHNPVFFGDAQKVDSDMCPMQNILHQWESEPYKGTNSQVFKRAGTMAAALVFKVMENKERSERDRLDIYAEASNGQMPNLDLINTVHYLAVHRQGLSVMVGTVSSLLNSAWLKITGEILQALGKLAKSLNPEWKFEITPADFVQGTATLASSIYYQAVGVPTGSHGAFRDYQVDAITLELSPRTSLNIENAQSAFLLRSGRLIEGVVRSVNNLLEKFHQSFFLYFLAAPNKFVSVGVYMIAFALLVAPLPIVAAALFSDSKRKGSSMDASEKSEEVEREADSWKWIHAAKVVLMVHLWTVIVSLLPYKISQFSGITPTTSMLLWVGFSVASHLILYWVMGSPYSCSSKNDEWKILKAATVAAASIGLGLMSIINFSTAQIGAMLLVPMCLMARPLKRHTVVGFSLRILVQHACNLALVLVGFPPAGSIIVKAFSEGFERASIGTFWEWAEFLWAWNSATYLYLLLVHLPCWLLCVLILCHP